MATVDTNLSFVAYVKEAFFRRVPVPLLGRMPANLMALGALGVLGLANPGFWLLGLAGELAYLAGVAGNSRFQKLVQGERVMSAQRGWENELAQAVTKLSEDGQHRYKRVLSQCRAIMGISEKLGGDLDSLRDMRSRNLNQLLVIFLRLLRSQELIESNMRPVDRGSIQRSITETEKALESADGNEALKRSLEGTLAIQKKRLENLGKAHGNLRLIEAEMLRIEQQVELLREESAISGSPTAISDKLDTVTTLMDETNRFLEENSEFLGSLDGDSVSEVPDLPKLPGAVSEG